MHLKPMPSSRGRGILANKLNEQVGTEIVNVIDDASMEEHMDGPHLMMKAALVTILQ